MSRAQDLIQGFVARLLEQAGAAVEPLAPAGLEFVAPAELQAALGVPELGRFGFGGELPERAERVGLDAAWLGRLGRVIGDRGRRAHWALEAPVTPLSDAEGFLRQRLVLQNGVYRLLDHGPTWTRYWIFVLRYVARSDERREGLLHLGVNLHSGSPLGDEALRFHEAARAASGRAGLPPAASILPADWSAERVGALLGLGVPPRVRRALAPFLTSMERRLARDLARLHQYHLDLAGEAEERSRKTAGSTSAQQIEAIERAYRSRVADLERRYALSVEVEAVQLLEVVAPVRRFELLLRRRKGERRFDLDWSALTRELEPLPCEHTYGPAGPRWLCDDALHIVGHEALAPCPGCNRERCHACHPRGCPRCGAGVSPA